MCDGLDGWMDGWMGYTTTAVTPRASLQSDANINQQRDLSVEYGSILILFNDYFVKESFKYQDRAIKQHPPCNECKIETQGDTVKFLRKI